MRTCYRNLRKPCGNLVDMHCVDGLITSIMPTGTEQSPAACDDIDCANQLLLPALVEPHVHLDKTLWGQPWRPNTAGPALTDYIANERRVLCEQTVPIAKRAGALLEYCIAQGSLYVRSHIDIDPDLGLSHVEAMLALRESYRDLVDLQFVAFPQTGLLIRPGTAELMQRALTMGVETVGGLDPAGIDGDPIGQLRVIFGMAEKHGCGVDIHLHDPGELGVWQIERIADFTAASGLAGKVMVSHAYCLGMVSEARAAAVGKRLANLGISLMTSAPADISVPPVALLKGLGVNVCCGSDGIRDAWSPFGNGDMLERAFLTAFRFDWNKDEQLVSAFECASTGGATALGVKDYGIAPGYSANFLIVPAETVGDALARRPRQRTVVSRGEIVARDGKMIRQRI